MAALGMAPSHCQSSCNARLAGASADNGFLPSAAISTLMLLVALCKWSNKIPTNGGRKDAVLECDAAARVLFEGLLLSCNNGKQWQLAVRSGQEWKPTWPLADASVVDFTILVPSPARLDLSDWERCAFSGEQSIAKTRAAEWWRAAIHTVEHDIKCYPFAVLLQRTGQKPACKNLHAQLVFAAAQRVEVGLLTSLNKGSPCATAVNVKVLDISKVLLNSRRLNTVLFKHVMGGVEASRSHSFIALTTDKANVWGPALQHGGFVLPDNSAFLAVPQVYHIM